MAGKLKEQHPEYKAYCEGDYSPVELAWCAYVSEEVYQEILEKYGSIREEIEKFSVKEGDKIIICYTRIITDIPGFHKDLEQYEIYNNRRSFEEFKSIVLGRFERWDGDKQIFECSLFQNIVEDLILFRKMPDDEIIDFYREIRRALDGREFQIIYLKTEDVAANIDVIRKERSDEQGNELWFPMMCEYFNTSPYAVERGLSGEAALLEHFVHRQELELRICREVFGDKYIQKISKA